MLFAFIATQTVDITHVQTSSVLQLLWLAKLSSFGGEVWEGLVSYMYMTSPAR